MVAHSSARTWWDWLVNGGPPLTNCRSIPFVSGIFLCLMHSCPSSAQHMILKFMDVVCMPILDWECGNATTWCLIEDVVTVAWLHGGFGTWGI
ncbi:hypothetical protein GOP47_0015617 [Adiantum capillus-veneris]|uniref:Uncharacterized protein n=1 Tax=Adiantum capillus-veneris TaxID=13818 RepID=A0A9D4UKX9_ADICA|nr:hypothetical protein GOP47_0015617 [Adiantum capillus-veneris]